jgi:hypothetical protein
MRKRYKVKEINKIKLKSYLKDKNNNKKNERNTRHRTGSTR